MEPPYPTEIGPFKVGASVFEATAACARRPSRAPRCVPPTRDDERVLSFEDFVAQPISQGLEIALGGVEPAVVLEESEQVANTECGDGAGSVRELR
jgi:hypothetical protein